MGQPISFCAWLTWGEGTGEKWQSKAEKRTGHEASGPCSVWVARMGKFLAWTMEEGRLGPSWKFSTSRQGSQVSKRMHVWGWGWGWGQRQGNAAGSGSWGWVGGRGWTRACSPISRNCVDPAKLARRFSQVFKSHIYTVDAESLSVSAREAKNATRRDFIWSLLTAPNPLKSQILEEGWGRGAQRKTVSRPHGVSLEPQPSLCWGTEDMRFWLDTRLAF